MIQTDILEFYGTNNYPTVFNAPEGALHDDILAHRKGIMYQLRQDILVNLRDEVLKELQHAIDGLLSIQEKTYGENGCRTNDDAIDSAELEEILDAEGLYDDEFQRSLSEEYAKIVKSALRSRDLLLADHEDPQGWQSATGVFLAPIWDYGYGGEAWADISEGGANLAKAKRISDIGIAMDVCISLMHNNSAVVEDFPSGERFWLLDCLSRKSCQGGGIFMNLGVHGVFKGENRGRKDTKVNGDLSKKYRDDLYDHSFGTPSFLFGVLEFLDDRVWAYAQVARAHYAHDRWILPGSHGAANRKFRSLIEENLGRLVQPLLNEIATLDLEVRRDIVEHINKTVVSGPGEHLFRNCGRSEEHHIMVSENLDFIRKQIKKVLIELKNGIRA